MSEHWRPRRRADCAGVPRPCPFVACRYNMFLDVRTDGRLVRLRGNKGPLSVDPATSCALDIAERGPRQVTEIAELLGVTKARISQLVDHATLRLRVLHEHDDIEPADFGPTLAEATREVC